MTKTNTNWDLGERIERLVQEHIAASRRSAQEALERAYGSAAKAQVRTEAVTARTLVKELDHANVVRYRDAFLDDDGAVVLVTELLQGRVLRELIAPGALDVDRALLLGKQLADAAAAVHAIGAVHRDIKPENVFVVGGDTVKLFDFGLAKVAAVPLKTTRPVGTPRYLAPDQLAASPRGAAPDARWDVYALGLVVFEMLAGVHPFDVDPVRAPKTPAEVIERHLAGDLPRLDAVVAGAPASLADALARAVAREPAARTATAALFAAELAAARRAYLAERADGGHHVTDELRKIQRGGAPSLELPVRGEVDDRGPASFDGPTLERARPGVALGRDAPPPATVRMPRDLTPAASALARSEDPPKAGRFGTEKMIPHVDPAALRRATDRKKQP